MENKNLIHVVMRSRKGPVSAEHAKEKTNKKPQHPRRVQIYALAAVVSLFTGAAVMSSTLSDTAPVFNHLTSGFEYDETIGQLQYVSSLLPESAMVFLSSESNEMKPIHQPSDAQTVHAWNEVEPWIEFKAMQGDEMTACLAGEVMDVVKNRSDEYTVRLLHEDGMESVYSGLLQTAISEGDQVKTGEIIGYCGIQPSFEFRRGGLSVKPLFSESEE